MNMHYKPVHNETWKISKNLNLTILVHSDKWFKENRLELAKWLLHENILSHNIDFYNNKVIFLYNDAQLMYFKMRWG